jgi:hypothetical protein
MILKCKGIAVCNRYAKGEDNCTFLGWLFLFLAFILETLFLFFTLHISKNVSYF